MAYDGFVMKRVQEEIHRIMRFPLRNVFAVKNIVYFSFQNMDLKVSLNPNYSYITVEKRNIPDNLKLTSFVSFLRSRLKNARVEKLLQYGYERTWKMVLTKLDEIGESHRYELYIDIMGKHSNIILVENGIILEAYKKVRTKYRNIYPGEPFLVFPLQKLNPENITHKLFENSDNNNKALLNFIYENIQGFSKLTSMEVLHRAGLENKPVSQLNEKEKEIIIHVIKQLIDEFKKGKLYLYYADDKPYEISAFPLKALNLDYEIFSDVFEGINVFFQWKERKSIFIQKQLQLEKAVIKNIDKLENVKDKLLKELSETENMEKYKKWGELLKAYFYQIKENQNMVTLYDWETEDYVKVPLERNLTIIENLQHYFRKYNKFKTKRSGITKRLEEIEKELEYLYQLWYTILEAETEQEMEEIRGEMISSGILKSAKHRKQKDAISKPREIIHNGFKILIGKNNKQNDKIVKLSSDNDIWLHAHEIPGAHVLIKTGGQKLDDDTLLFAASLAAGYSKGKDSAKVPVDYTKAKYVKKIKGLKPGMVFYENYKTLMVSPRRL
ncbi:NFACT family protein [Thermosipho ferrireducens]|uniref:Rqc2 homolog RqcH n=1 Tax=Thermosipho ferrireducens TaxID=2571116 RepID=A0ABX7S6B9_9BACT|nr:NFACT family protein [Thermosipho ferrireducens]QTA37418.1 NFACT family protein [Thermosipho ferrireducens]